MSFRLDMSGEVPYLLEEFSISLRNPDCFISDWGSWLLTDSDGTMVRLTHMSAARMQAMKELRASAVKPEPR